MKKAKNVKVGSIVKVPYYQFAPMRSGWNGWLFTLGEVIQVGKSKSGKDMARISYINENAKLIDGKCTMIEQDFYLASVFDAQSNIDFEQSNYDDVEGQIERYNNPLQLVFCMKHNLIKTI